MLRQEPLRRDAQPDYPLRDSILAESPQDTPQHLLDRVVGWSENRDPLTGLETAADA